MFTAASALVLIHLSLAKKSRNVTSVCALVKKMFEVFVYLKIASFQRRCLCNICELFFFFFNTGVYIYHLRCYVYQARNLMALDKDSFSGMEKSH